MVTVPRGPRPFLLPSQLLLTCTLFAFVGAINAFAQDRVTLFESFVGSATAPLPGAIREIHITQGGRSWSLVRSVPLPPHFGRRPVALADGSRIAWLAVTGDSTILVQYDATTARASIVDIGRFDRDAHLASDPLRPRLYIIEPRRVTLVDYRLQSSTIELGSSKVTRFAQATGLHLVLHRDSPEEIVVIDTQTNRTNAVIPLDEASTIRGSRNGRLYRHYSHFVESPVPQLEPRLDVLSLATGALIARAQGGPSGPTLFEVDDSRGVLVHDAVDVPSGRRRIFVRDAISLSVVGEFAPGVYSERQDLSLSQIATRTILMFSRRPVINILDPCSNGTPRVDIFDGTTLALVNQIDLGGRCPHVVPLPSQ